MMEDKKLVILLGSLSQAYDATVRITEAREHGDLNEATEMLWRECDTMIRREKQGTVFKADTSRGQSQGLRDVMRGRSNNWNNQGSVVSNIKKNRVTVVYVDSQVDASSGINWVLSVTNARRRRRDKTLRVFSREW